MFSDSVTHGCTDPEGVYALTVDVLTQKVSDLLRLGLVEVKPFPSARCSHTDLRPAANGDSLTLTIKTKLKKIASISK